MGGRGLPTNTMHQRGSTLINSAYVPSGGTAGAGAGAAAVVMAAVGAGAGAAAMVVVVGWQQGQPSKTIPAWAGASSVCIHVYDRVSCVSIDPFVPASCTTPPTGLCTAAAAERGRLGEGVRGEARGRRGQGADEEAGHAGPRVERLCVLLW